MMRKHYASVINGSFSLKLCNAYTQTSGSKLDSTIKPPLVHALTNRYLVWHWMLPEFKTQPNEREYIYIYIYTSEISRQFVRFTFRISHKLISINQRNIKLTHGNT